MQYPRRSNEDGSIDSICPRCFITVATSYCATDLDQVEAAHDCAPERLEYYQSTRQTTTKKPVSKQEAQPVEAIESIG